MRIHKINIGCDPEFFFRRGKTIVGSEKVLPKGGLESICGDVIIDGVQAELNPHYSFCIALLAKNIQTCLYSLNKSLEGTRIETDFSQVVKLSAADMRKLSEDSKKFGCAPSKNDGTEHKIEVDASKYKYRSAGGHIHLGSRGDREVENDVLRNDELQRTTVQLLDLICGNTLVLLDRDKGNIERRKVYGKAGEYRTPKHGLEYRTPSNFWLISYPMMALTFSLARFAVVVHYSGKAEEYLKCVDREDIKKAINENDFDLALENFKKISALLDRDCKLSDDLDDNGEVRTPFAHGGTSKFIQFAKEVNRKGLHHFFPEDPMHHWINHGDFHQKGWYEFIHAFSLSAD